MQDSEWLRFPRDVPYRFRLVKGKVPTEQNQSRLSLFGVKDSFDTPPSNIVGSRSLVLALRSVGITAFHRASETHRSFRRSDCFKLSAHMKLYPINRGVSD